MTRREDIPITYTSRRGHTYYLCRGLTKTGKARYYFAREPGGEPVDEIPPGYTITESVNAIVSLSRPRQTEILPEEVAAVEAAVRRHPHAHNYRVDVRRDRIDIYERTGGDAADLARVLGVVDWPGMVDRLRATAERHANYKAVLRFILADADQRHFRAQRWCYRGSIDNWIDLHYTATGPVEELARALVPALDTEEFFELW